MPQLPDFSLMQNTMQGLDVNGLTEALTQRLQQELAARSQQATQESAQAQDQYQQAAQAPPPDLSPLQQFLPTLFGNLASQIAEDPGFRERAQQGLLQQKKDLLQTRSDNLVALRDVWKQRSDAADEAGDLEASTKAKMEIEKLSRLSEQMLEQQRHQGRLELQKKGQEGDVEIEGMRQRGRANDDQKQAMQERRRVGQATASIATAVRADPDIKNFVTVRDQFDMGLKASQDKSNLGDILLMRAIARVSDPMSSVREEEFRTFKGAQGALAQQGVNLTKAMWGKGMLNQFGREQMTGQLRKIYNSKKVQYDRAYNQYRLRAASEGVPEEIVLRDFTSPEGVESEDATINPVPAGPQARAEAMKAARTKDLKRLADIIKANPALDNDPELMKAYKAAKGK